MHLSIIGTGYVGLVTGACFAEFGLHVICVDKDGNRVQSLKNGKIPFYEPGLEKLVASNVRQGRLEFTTDVEKGVKSSLVIFIAVGTPSNGDGSANLSHVFDVGRTIAQFMSDYKIVVTKSTVPVGTTRKLKALICESIPPSVCVDVVSNPEFLREGSAIEDFMRPNRIMIGVESIQARAIMQDLYRPLYLSETPIVFTNLETAELTKYATNAFLATKVTFINEIANLCETVGADIHHVAKGLGLDRRIGSKFLHPGPGFGGSCLPKDIAALLTVAENNDCQLRIVKAVQEANVGQKHRMVHKIKKMVGDLDKKTIGLLGLSFKPNTDDVRESPAIDIIKLLQKEGAMVKAFDPIAMNTAAAALSGVVFCTDAYETAKGADAIVLVTEWNQFRNLDLARIRNSLKSPIFIDLRNVYEPTRMEELGFAYTSVGRAKAPLRDK